MGKLGCFVHTYFLQWVNLVIVYLLGSAVYNFKTRWTIGLLQTVSPVDYITFSTFRFKQQKKICPIALEIYQIKHKILPITK